MYAQQPQFDGFDATLLAQFEDLKNIISGVRNIRQQRNIPKEQLLLQIVAADRLPQAAQDIVIKQVNLSKIEYVEQKAKNAAAFIVGTTEYAVPLDKFINVDEELKKLQADLAYQEGFLQNVMKKLSNERFVQNAKPEIVAMERKKQADAESRIAAIKQSIAELTH